MSRKSLIGGGILLAAGTLLAVVVPGAERVEKKLTLVYNVNTSGYIDVCGCKHKEIRQGSLTRRASFIKQLRATDRQLLLVDGGSSLFPIEDRVKDSDIPEAMRKAELIVEAYNRMGYGALGVGSFDLAAGIDNLKKLEARAKFPFLSANLVDGSTGKLYFKPHAIVQVGGAKIGLIGLTLNTMSRTYLDKVAPQAQLLDPVDAARKSLGAMQGQVDAVIALSHLREETSAELAAKLPELEIIVDPYIQYGNHHTWIKEEEWVGYRDSTLFLRGDGQGSRLGILDIRIFEPRAKLVSEDRLAELQELESSGSLTDEQKAEKAAFAGKNLFRFLRISLEPHHKTDPDFEQLYQKWLQKVDPSTVPVLADPLPAKGNFLTVEGCKACHEPQYDRWLKTRHAEAFATLVQSGDDAQFDCVGCHSVGYGEAFLQMGDIGAYANVQCESCHGTSPEHAREPEKHRFGPVAREACMTCHNKEVLDKEFDFFTEKKKVQCPKG